MERWGWEGMERRFRPLRNGWKTLGGGRQQGCRRRRWKVRNRSRCLFRKLKRRGCRKERMRCRALGIRPQRRFRFGRLRNDGETRKTDVTAGRKAEKCLRSSTRVGRRGGVGHENMGATMMRCGGVGMQKKVLKQVDGGYLSVRE